LSRAELHLNQIAVAGDQTAADLWIGIYTPWSYTYSRQHRREGGAGPGRDRVRSDGWLQLRYFELDYEDTRAFKAVVTYNRTGGGTEKTYSFSSATIAGVDGIHRFPVLSKSDKVTIKLTDSSGHEPATFHRTRWEGVYNRRTRSR
jgi:hypothetical protein